MVVLFPRESILINLSCNINVLTWCRLESGLILLVCVDCYKMRSLNFIYFVTLLQRDGPSLLEVEAGGKSDASDALALALQEKVFYNLHHLDIFFFISVYLVFSFPRSFFPDQSICCSDLW